MKLFLIDRGGHVVREMEGVCTDVVLLPGKQNLVTQGEAADLQSSPLFPVRRFEYGGRTLAGAYYYEQGPHKSPHQIGPV